MKRSPSALITPTLLLLAAGCGQAPEAARRHAPNVVLVCLDTVRADHLGCYGYDRHPTTPAMDALAARSTVFLDASSTAGWTKPSVPSYMTGLYPTQTGVFDGSSRDEAGATSDVLPQAATTIAEVFQGAGYATAAFVKNAQIRAGQGLEQGFDSYLDEAGDARAIRWSALDWLDETAPTRAQDGAPFFLYLHYLDAHWPYPIPAEYAARFADAERLSPFLGDDWKGLRDRINDGTQTLSEEELETLLAIYDGALRYLDDQLAALFAGLELRGLAEDTIVCIVSDHGEDFLEHGRVGHGHGLYETLLHVPWILHVPGRAPARVEAQVSLVDLFPTLVAAAGLPGGHPVEGLDRLASPDAAAPCLAEHKGSRHYLQAARRGDQKLVRRFEHREAHAAEPAAPADPAALVGRQVRIELAVDRTGAALAERVRLRGGDADEPIELKGPIEAVSADRLRVAGFEVRLAPGYERYGEVHDAAGAPVELRPGLPVKAKLEPDGDGLACYSLKLYGSGEDPAPELRGRVAACRDGALTVGDLRVGVDERTRVEVAPAGAPRLSRADVLELARSAGEGRVEERFSLALSAFDLGADPLELAPRASAPFAPALGAWLDRVGARLAEAPLWTAADRSVLSGDDLEALRKIGYTE